MKSVLEIARDVADDISLDAPVALFGPPGHEDGDTTARRLRRAIEATCHYLQANHDWQELKREHAFLTVAGELQPGAIPADFSRFVGGTMIDISRQLPLQMAETDEDWKNMRLYGFSYPPRWIRQGNDIRIHPGYEPGLNIGYTYVSNAICEEPAKSWEVIGTTDGMTLAIGKRYIVKSGHTVIIPPMGPADSIELVPEAGEWRNLGCNFTTADNGPMVSICPVDFRDWIVIAKQGATHEFRPHIGAWLEIAIPTVDGMMLEAGRRYLVKQGHRVELPVLAALEQIELVPDTGSWLSHGSRFTTRDGLIIAPPQLDVGLVTVTADMQSMPQYLLTPGNGYAPYDKVFARGRRKSKITTDTDVPIWDAELVTLGAIWRMQYRDGNQYTEEFRAFQRMIYDRVKGSQGYGKIDMNGSRSVKFPLRPNISGMMVTP